MKKFVPIAIICLSIVFVSFFTFSFNSSNIDIPYMTIFSLSWDNKMSETDKMEYINTVKDEVQRSREKVDYTVSQNWFLLLFIPIATLTILLSFFYLEIDGSFYNSAFDNRYKTITYILGTVFMLVSIHTVVEATIVQHYNKTDSLIATHQIKLFVESVNHLSGNVAVDRAIRSTELEYTVRKIHNDIELFNNRIWFCRYIQFFTWLAFFISFIMRWLRVFETKIKGPAFKEFLEQEKRNL